MKTRYKITLAVLCVFLMGSDLNTGRPPVDVEDVADDTADNVLGWDDSGVAVSQSREGVRVTNSVSVTISNSSSAVIPFDTERFDDNDIHDTVTNNSRLTVQVDGRYFIIAQIRWDSNSTGIRGINILLNGSLSLSQVQADAASASTMQHVSTVYNLDVDDYVEVSVFQTSGGNLDVDKIGGFAPEFSMQLLRSQ